MPYHTFTIGGSEVSGFRVTDIGDVEDFHGSLRKTYESLRHASAAARRKYQDSSITVTECIPKKTRYRVRIEDLLKIAEKID